MKLIIKLNDVTDVLKVCKKIESIHTEIDMFRYAKRKYEESTVIEEGESDGDIHRALGSDG